MRTLPTLVLLLAIWPFPSGKTYPMTADQSVPAASGTVKVQTGSHNRNTTLDVKVANLAKPTSLTPPANVYILWVRPSGGSAINEGAIRVNKNLNGELKVVTTLKSCDVFITAEQSPTATSPDGLNVLHTHISAN